MAVMWMRNAQKPSRAGLKSAQLTLLSPEREQHDELKGAVCFDDTVRAAFHLQRAGVAVQICFVAMAANADRFQEVLELCAVLGLKNVSYNRMSPTGGAVHHIERLMPTIEQVEANLRVANDLAPQLGISVGTAMPIPPCLVRMEDYPNVRFGFCSTGTQAPNIVVDPRGQRAQLQPRQWSAGEPGRAGLGRHHGQPLPARLPQAGSRDVSRLRL